MQHNAPAITGHERLTMTSETGGQSAPSSLPCSTSFVNVDGYWINPAHVVSVEHEDKNEHFGEEQVVITTVMQRITLIGWTARQACQVVDKLEGNPTD
jgi:hypothetical protein